MEEKSATDAVLATRTESSEWVLAKDDAEAIDEAEVTGEAPGVRSAVDGRAVVGLGGCWSVTSMTIGEEDRDGAEEGEAAAGEPFRVGAPRGETGRAGDRGAAGGWVGDRSA